HLRERAEVELKLSHEYRILRQGLGQLVRCPGLRVLPSRVVHDSDSVFGPRLEIRPTGFRAQRARALVFPERPVVAPLTPGYAGDAQMCLGSLSRVGAERGPRLGGGSRQVVA